MEMHHTSSPAPFSLLGSIQHLLFPSPVSMGFVLPCRPLFPHPLSPRDNRSIDRSTLRNGLLWLSEQPTASVFLCLDFVVLARGRSRSKLSSAEQLASMFLIISDEIVYCCFCLDVHSADWPAGRPSVFPSGSISQYARSACFRYYQMSACSNTRPIQRDAENGIGIKWRVVEFRQHQPRTNHGLRWMTTEERQNQISNRTE